ncbi:MAG TPA: 7-carboxy-7-deazaguanine synthase QueE [Chthoniobacterales bacterium]|nr:7-carboxy-7-deazaguanine synthase QueE [Chthoniobacterales bacterium]
MRYPLTSNPIFWTIQGEGHLRGMQMCFVRLAGCSVGCPACDTDYRKREMATAEEIAARANDVTPKDVRERWIWITGGEPTDHNLTPLIDALRAKQFSIALASSGHRQVAVSVDWLSISPHDPAKWVQLSGDEVKLVPGLNGFGIEDFRAAQPDEQTDFRYRYVQPLSREKQEDPESLRVCLEFLRTNPNWRLSRQDHHYWSVA